MYVDSLSWCFASDLVVDNEFTQLMKGLQGERIRQAFHYLDKDEDGFIRPEEFKRIILVRLTIKFSNSSGHIQSLLVYFVGDCWPQTIRRCHRQAAYPLHLESGTTYILFGSRRFP